MGLDARGLELTAANDTAVRAYDRTIDRYLAFGRDTGPRLKETFGADAAMPMAHVLRGTFFNLMGMPALLPKAAESLAAARATAAGATARERMHMDALEAWCKGELEQATALWERILAQHPLDILALKLAAYVHFYLGDSAAVRDCVARVLPAWEEKVPGYACMLGMHAFGLEECGDYAGAEREGRRAVEMDPSDPWAVHAVAHVLEMQDRRREGIEWIEGLEAHWNACNNFRYHLWWHLALTHLALERYDAVLELYDASLYDPQSEEYLDLCNDIALLARLEMAGIEVGNRWRALADKVERQRAGRVLAFVDAHYLIATHAAQGQEAADAFIGSLRAHSNGAGGTTARVNAEVGVSLAEALTAFRNERYARCTEILHPLRDRLYKLGGSHAQRDLFAQVLMEAALRSGRFDIARALSEERTRLRPNNLLGWRAYARALAGSGDQAGERGAIERAERIVAQAFEPLSTSSNPLERTETHKT
jgi:tetratricopeptide (TPR) repeat protein